MKSFTVSSARSFSLPAGGAPHRPLDPRLLAPQGPDMPETRLPHDSAYFFAKLSESQELIRQLQLSRRQAAEARLRALSSAGIPTARSTGLPCLSSAILRAKIQQPASHSDSPRTVTLTCQAVQFKEHPVHHRVLGQTVPCSPGE